jgi:hypothetical protein
MGIAGMKTVTISKRARGINALLDQRARQTKTIPLNEVKAELGL